MATPAVSHRVLSERQAQALRRFARAIYPHDTFEDALYEPVVAALDDKAAADPEAARVLQEGVQALDHPSPFFELDGAQQEERAAALADSAFFALVRSTAVVSLYDSPEVWRRLGYEGPSFEQGGYLQRGFDEIEWLPNPGTE